MKKMLRTSLIFAAIMLIFAACENEEQENNSFEGIYKGSLVQSGYLKHVTGSFSSFPGDSADATAVISKTGENEIEVHCYTHNFDTTFRLNYYEHHDSAYVCFTDSDFEEMYGHMLGEGHMGGMMDDMHDGETEWMHHLNEEHGPGDEHFGGFDMDSHTFSFIFKLMQRDSATYHQFHGTKQ